MGMTLLLVDSSYLAHCLFVSLLSPPPSLPARSRPTRVILTLALGVSAALSLSVNAFNRADDNYVEQHLVRPHVLHRAHPPSFNNAFAIANSVDPTANTLTLTIPSVPAEDGYTLQFVNVSDINQVYATSGSFAIGAEASSSAPPPTASGDSSASATGGAGGTESGSVNGTASSTSSGSGSGSVRPTSTAPSSTGPASASASASAPSSSGTGAPSSASRTRTLPAAAAAIVALVGVAFAL
ncbi:hypothetical protein DFH09DRAFT_1368809 [Mycena vulgaris]|nr:hypothetical protein DFH09DRAFT_1368809 [Mycena vulgaris]